MSTHSAIIQKTNTGYRGIYCHFDGYIDGVGKCLFEHYQDEDKVSRLIDLGNLSRLGQDETSKYTYAYHRDRGEYYDEESPTEGPTLNSVADKIDHSGYIYVYKNKKWYVNGKELDQNSKDDW